MVRGKDSGLEVDAIVEGFSKQLERQRATRREEKLFIYRLCAEEGCLHLYNERWHQYRRENPSR